MHGIHYWIIYQNMTEESCLYYRLADATAVGIKGMHSRRLSEWLTYTNEACSFFVNKSYNYNTCMLFSSSSQTVDGGK